MVYFDQSLHTYACQHFLNTCIMDEALLSSLSVNENAHNSWTTWYIWIKVCILIYFNNVQPSECKNGDEAAGRIYKRRQLPKITKNYAELKSMQIEIINNNNILKAWYRKLHDQQVYTIITVWVCLSVQFAFHTFHWLIYVHHGSCTLQSVDSLFYS